MSEPQLKPADNRYPPDAKLIKGMDINDYHNHKAISKSRLHDYVDCPKTYDWIWNKGNREEKDCFTFGNAFHCSVLEPDDFSERYVTFPEDWLTKPNHPRGLTIVEQKEEFKGLHEGKGFLPQTDIDKINDMNASFLAEPTCRVLFPDKGIIEPSIFWNDPYTGLRLKFRPDFMLPEKDIIVDVKTSGLVKGASKKKFQRQAHDLAYYTSCAMAARGYEAFYGRPLKKYYFAVIETKPPHCAASYDADKELFERGTLDLDKYLPRMQRSIELDYWPSYNESILMLDLPVWAKKELEYGDE